MNNVEDIVICQGLKVFKSVFTILFPCSRNEQVTFAAKQQLKLSDFRSIIIV